MILEEFDKSKKAILNACDIRKQVDGMPKTCLSFFSKNLMKEIIKIYNPTIIAKISNATAEFPVYKLDLDGQEIAIWQSAVGAPACVSNYEELIAMGVRNFLLVGCCGCLQENIEEYSIILPTSAIRDEGTSYHYAPAFNEVELNKDVIAVIEKVLKSKKIKYIKGKTWTTDAIFRETKNKVNTRIKQGCITVEMECSAMAVVSKYRKVRFGQIFYAADNLSGEEYSPRNLVFETDFDKKKKIIPLAIECAKAINNKYLINK